MSSELAVALIALASSRSLLARVYRPAFRCRVLAAQNDL